MDALQTFKAIYAEKSTPDVAAKRVQRPTKDEAIPPFMQHAQALASGMATLLEQLHRIGPFYSSPPVFTLASDPPLSLSNHPHKHQLEAILDEGKRLRMNEMPSSWAHEVDVIVKNQLKTFGETVTRLSTLVKSHETILENIRGKMTINEFVDSLKDTTRGYSADELADMRLLNLQTLHTRKSILSSFESCLARIAKQLLKLGQKRQRNLVGSFTSSDSLSLQKQKRQEDSSKPSQGGRARASQSSFKPELDSSNDSKAMQELRAMGVGQAIIMQETKELHNIEQEELDLANQAERTMNEVSDLVSSFSMLVNQQSETITSIQQNVFEALDHIDLGNEQLSKALDRGDGTMYCYITIFLLCAFCLLFFHFLIN